MSGESTLPASAGLFEPLTIRGVTLPNRIMVSPMCQYSCENGLATDWHLVHLGTRAVGGAGLVMAEATAVAANGRISPQDLGIWSDAHVEPLQRIAQFVHSQGSVAGIQLAHAGRKASVSVPWQGGHKIGEEEGGWSDVVAPSAIPYAADYAQPRAISEREIAGVVREFGAATRRAAEAGFRVIEIHAAHGYLLHEFLSPLSNRRNDRYGGSFENRTRIVREVVEEVRRHWPEMYPLFLRVSATDWAEGGWDVEECAALARIVAPLGVDLVDCSSGGNIASAVASIPLFPGYQTRFAERIRREAAIRTGAVGLITSAAQAEQILRTGQADLIVMAREMLRSPYWPMHAARELGQTISWPVQYLRAAPSGTAARQPTANGRAHRFAPDREVEPKPQTEKTAR